MRLNHLLQSARGIFVNGLIRYGAGADRLRPIMQTSWWNAASWVLIVVGLIGWAIFIFWPY